MNSVFIIGNLTADPQPITTSTGKTVVHFSIAENDKVLGKDTTNFFNCTAWNSQANYIGSYLKKGQQVAIQGRLNKRSYVNKEGKNVSSIEIVVENIKSLGGKSKQANNDENLVSVNANFNSNVVDQTAETNKSSQSNQSDDGLTELNWINEEEGK